MTWRPECGGKFRANLAFKVDGRFPAQVSVVGEAVDVGGGGSKGRGDARKGRKRAKGQSAGGADGGKRRSLSQETASRGAGPYTSVSGGVFLVFYCCPFGAFWCHLEEFSVCVA